MWGWGLIEGVEAEADANSDGISEVHWAWVVGLLEGVDAPLNLLAKGLGRTPGR